MTATVGKMESMDNAELLSVEDLARFLGKSPQAIYNMRHRGEGPRAVKVGRSLRFRPADVEVWLEANADPRPAA